MKMRKYIDADKAIKDYAHYGIKHFYDATDLEAILNECPAADVQEVRHGKWEWNESIKTEDMDGWFIDEQGYVCSECGFIGVDNFNYCPNCGAKMDEVSE